MKTIKLSIEGMTCGGCVRNATSRLQTVKGVSRVEVDLASGIAVVEADETVTGNHLCAALNGVTPYTARVL